MLMISTGPNAFVASIDGGDLIRRCDNPLLAMLFLSEGEAEAWWNANAPTLPAIGSGNICTVPLIQRPGAEAMIATWATAESDVAGRRWAPDFGRMPWKPHAMTAAVVLDAVLAGRVSAAFVAGDRDEVPAECPAILRALVGATPAEEKALEDDPPTVAFAAGMVWLIRRPEDDDDDRLALYAVPIADVLDQLDPPDEERRRRIAERERNKAAGELRARRVDEESSGRRSQD